MKKAKSIDNKSKFVKVEYPKGSRSFSYGFFQTTEGQEYLKVIKEKRYKLSCICNGADKEIPLYVADYVNLYVIKNYRNIEGNKTKHSLSCPRCGEEDEKKVPIPKQKEEQSIEITRSENSISAINLKANDFIDVDNEFKKKEYKPDEYVTMFRQGEVLLNLAWESYVMKEGKLPKEGNLLHTLYKEIMPKVKINKVISLSDITFIPNYRKVDNDKTNEITEIIKKASYSTYKKGCSDKCKGYFMYILAKLNQELEVDENTIELTLSDPYKKGTFVIYVSKDYYNRQHTDKIKVFNADYYISCLVSTDYNIVKAEKIATIPVLKDRGCYMQSSKEIEFADMLISKGILFLRQTYSSNRLTYRGYAPNFLLLDKETKKITAIAEVFGFYHNDYMKDMEKKIKYFSAQTQYKFIYWKANKNEPMPEI